MAGIFNLFSTSGNVESKATTATTIKTLAQVQTTSTQGLQVLNWSISFDASAAGQPLICELGYTDKAAAVTAVTPNKWAYAGDDASALSSGTGINATNEGAITTYTLLDVALVSPTAGYMNWFPLGQLPMAPAGPKTLRIRVTGSSGVTPGAAFNLIWQE